MDFHNTLCLLFSVHSPGLALIPWLFSSSPLQFSPPPQLFFSLLCPLPLTTPVSFFTFHSIVCLFLIFSLFPLSFCRSFSFSQSCLSGRAVWDSKSYLTSKHLSLFSCFPLRFCLLSHPIRLTFLLTLILSPLFRV